MGRQYAGHLIPEIDQPWRLAPLQPQPCQGVALQLQLVDQRPYLAGFLGRYRDRSIQSSERNLLIPISQSARHQRKKNGAATHGKGQLLVQRTSDIAVTP